MGKYLKMADVFPVEIRTDDESGSLICDEDGIILESFSGDKVADYTLHAINSHDELVEINKYLLSKLEEIDECFEAAYIDGLSDAFANEDIYTIKDIYCRRIEFARGVAVSAICKENK